MKGEFAIGTKILKKILILFSIFIFVSSATATSFENIKTTEKTEFGECFGFIIEVSSNQSDDIQTNISRLINELLRNDIDVYWNTKEISVLTQEILDDISQKNRIFNKGCFFVAISNDSYKNIISNSVILKHHLKGDVKVFKILQSINDLEVLKLKEPKIVHHNGPWYYSQSYFNHLYKGGFYNQEFLSWKEIPDNLNNEEYNLFIWGGLEIACTPLIVYNHAIYSKAINTVRQFINKGGSLLGSCFAGYEVSVGSRIPLHRLRLFFPNLPSYHMLLVANTRPFIFYCGGFINVTITDFDTPVTYGLPSNVETFQAAGPVFLKPRGNTKSIAKVEEIYSGLPSLNSLLMKFYKKFLLDKPIWIDSKFGDGKLVIFGDHPEMYQYNHSRIVYNAVFYLTSEGPYKINFHNTIVFGESVLEIIAPENANTGETVMFNASFNKDKTSYEFYWEFGDNTTSSNYNTTHIYNYPGKYMVLLTVIDNENNVFNDWINITIQGQPTAINHPPEKPILYAVSPVIVRPSRGILLIANTEDSDGDLFYYNYYLYYLKNNTVMYNFTGAYLYSSGQNNAIPFSYYPDEYNYKVRAIDTKGAESEWSDPIKIVITRFPNITRILNMLGL